MADEAKDWVEARAEELRERSSELLRGEPVSENDAHLAAQRADVAHQHAADAHPVWRTAAAVSLVTTRQTRWTKRTELRTLRIGTAHS